MSGSAGRSQGARSGRAGVPLLCAALLALAVATAPAAAGQIVYRHGPDIWAMNDDGSGAHPVVTVAQVPGMSSIAAPEVFPNGGTSIAFEGTTLAYQAPVGSGPAGSCGLNCTGVYTLDDGAVTRVSNFAAPCGPSPAWCGSFSTSPTWTADGRIAYEYDQYTWEYSCLTFPCGWRFTTSLEEVHVVPATANAGPGVIWSLEHGGDRPVTSRPIPDPADPSKLAYVGGLVNCGTGCETPPYISSGNGTDTPVGYDDILISVAWSPDGSEFADVEGGGERGIWTYAADAAETPGKQFAWALQDPLQTGSDPGDNPFDVTFEDVAWLGTSRIVFSAEGNLWTIPASCGAGGTPCQFPGDATRLTNDGTAAAPDAEPSWTSSTATIGVVSDAGAGGGGAAAAGGGVGAGAGAPPVPVKAGKGGEAGRPRAARAALSGVSAGKAKLAFTLTAGAKAKPLKKITVRLPHGLSFAAAPAARRAGISLRDAAGRKPRFKAVVGHAVVVITLRKPATEIAVSIRRPAIVVDKALAKRVDRGLTKKLKVVVKATDVGNRTTAVTLRLRPQ